jgi:NAD-dependent dihydropyrimidine dehydrogenase PreA subunit
MFTPEEASLALYLTFRPSSTQQISDKAAAYFSPELTGQLLEGMFSKGSIGWKEKEGVSQWFVLSMVVGMYEAQAGKPARSFLIDANKYMKTMSFGRSFIAVTPPQMRTIPINQSISIEHHIATYDDIRTIVMNLPGPFVALNCICRVNKQMQGQPCTQTSREETCLAFNDMAEGLIRRKLGREISKNATLEILRQNEEDGLVLQPANAQNPEFICSCCGCCCGMLQLQKFLPYPLEFWATNYVAELAKDECSGCGVCVSRCQVNAIRLDSSNGTISINADRCIGCGLCVPTCQSNALALKKKTVETIPPADEESLYEEVMKKKRGLLAQWVMMIKVILRKRQ